MSVLEELAEGLWTISFPFRAGGVELGTKTTVVKLERGLLLISPGPLDQSVRESLAELGPVVGLIAPNKMHHLFLSEALSHYPDAKVFLAPGLEKKRPDLQGHETLSDTPPPLWGGCLQQILVRGMPKLNEVAFFHEASATLILTDLAFNFREHKHWLTRLVLKFNKALDGFGPTRLLRIFFLSDKELLRQDLNRILAWPIEQIVVAHGENLHQNGREVLAESYSWLNLSS